MSTGTMLVVHVPSASYALKLMKNLMDEKLPFVVSSHLDDVNNFARSKLLGPPVPVTNPGSSISNHLPNFNTPTGHILEAGPSNQYQLPTAHVNTAVKVGKKRKKMYFDYDGLPTAPAQPPYLEAQEEVTPQLFSTEKPIKEEVPDEEVAGTMNGLEEQNIQPACNNGDSLPKEEQVEDIPQLIAAVLKTTAGPPPAEKSYPGVVVKAVRGVHSVVLYKFIVVDRNTGKENLMCYAFTFIKCLKFGKIYCCLACKNLRKNVALTVSEDGEFLKNPVALPHICQPTSYAQERAKRMIYAKLQQLRSEFTTVGITPKDIFNDMLAEVDADPHSGPRDKECIREALGPFEKYKRPIADAILKGRGASLASLSGIRAAELLGDDYESV